MIFDPDTHEIKKKLIVKTLNVPYFANKPESDLAYLPTFEDTNDEFHNENEEIDINPNVNENSNNDNPSHYNLRYRTNVSYTENYCYLDKENVNTRQSDPLLYTHIDRSDQINLNDYYLDDKDFIACFNVNHTK